MNRKKKGWNLYQINTFTKIIPNISAMPEYFVPLHP